MTRGLKGRTLYQGTYELKDAISSGGFATVYLAFQRDRPEPLALKIGIVSDNSAHALMRQEARIIGELTHRNIVTIFPIPFADHRDLYYASAIEVVGNPVFFVMEYLSGGTLDQYLNQVGALTVEEATTIGLEVARALDYIHRKNYAHNDLKLENILFRQPVEVGEPFSIALIDFGTATSVKPPDAGSRYVMPPEQVARAKMDVAPELSTQLDLTKIDVWGLGVVLYRMLGGRLPFASRSEKRLTDLIMNSRPTSLQSLSESIPAELDDLVVGGCLAKNPADRPTILEVGQRLRHFGQGAVASKSSSDKSGRWSFRLPWKA